MQKLINQVLPFVLIGVIIVAFTFGVMLLAYLFLFGAVIGFLLYLAAWVKSRFFAPKVSNKPLKKTGRTFDSNDWKKMG